MSHCGVVAIVVFWGSPKTLLYPETRNLTNPKCPAPIHPPTHPPNHPPPIPTQPPCIIRCPRSCCAHIGNAWQPTPNTRHHPASTIRVLQTTYEAGTAAEVPLLLNVTCSLPWPSCAAHPGLAQYRRANCQQIGGSCMQHTSYTPSCVCRSSRQGARWWGRSPWPPEMVSHDHA